MRRFSILALLLCGTAHATDADDLAAALKKARQWTARGQVEVSVFFPPRTLPTRTAAFEARIKQRYRSEQRFKALGLIAGRGFDIVLLDMALPGMPGLPGSGKRGRSQQPQRKKSKSGNPAKRAADERAAAAKAAAGEAPAGTV